jgi:hypothetical protein
MTITFSIIPASQIETLAAQLSGDRLYQLVKSIDNIIKFRASQSEFQCDIVVSAFDENQKLPEEIYTLTNIYQSRGFNTVYDGTPQDELVTNVGDMIVIAPSGDQIAPAPSNGKMTIKWYAPRMSFQDIKETPNPEVIRIPDLGFNFYAHTLYLCETNGIDLRQFTTDYILRQLDILIKRAAIDGLTYVNYMGPNGLFQSVPTNSLVSLYEDVNTQLATAGYTSSFVNGILSVTWTLDPDAPDLPAPGDGSADPNDSVDLTFTYIREVPSAEWNIQHNLGKYVSVTIVDENNAEMVGAVNYIDENNVRIDFSVPVSGKAFLN